MSANIEVIKAVMPFEQLIDSFCDCFVKEYGESKAREVITNVERSNKASKFLSDSRAAHKRYNHMSFISVIQTGRRFLLKQADIVCFASIILLEKWRIEVGDVLGLSDERYLKMVLFDILSECEKHKANLNNSPTLYSRYYHFLLTAQDNFADFFESQIEGSFEREIDNINGLEENEDANNKTIQEGGSVEPEGNLPF